MTGASRAPVALVGATLLLTLCGVVLVGIGISGTRDHAAQHGVREAAPSVPVTSTPQPEPSRRSASAQPPASAPPSAAAPPAAGAGGNSRSQNLPPTMSGPGADAAVQRALDAAVPADLPAGVAEDVADLGREVWLAEVTGDGRGRWPGYFAAHARTALYTRVRVQAAIGRQNPEGPGAVVHLVWAGAGPAGTFMDGRSATVHFIRKGETGTWTPQR